MPKTRQLRSIALRLFRAALFIGILTLIHLKHREWKVDQDLHRSTGGNIPIEMVREFFPSADIVESGAVLDRNSNELGTIIQSSPESDSIIGYSGPTNSLIALGADGALLGIRILSTRDTPEHLAIIEKDPDFLKSLNGTRWTDLQDSLQEVDGVTGATLTSRAIIAGIARRNGGDARSFLFTKPLTLEEAQAFFPAISSLDQIIRTSPHSDRIIGYGGPSDVIIGLEPDGDTILGVAVRESFDTQQYVDDVTSDTWFMDGFKEKKLSEIASRVPRDDDIEGVSGATMTSMAMADAVYKAAEIRNQVAPDTFSLKITIADITTIVIVCLALLISFTRLKGNRRLRIAFHLLLVGYLGFVNGHLISQALIVGWAQDGIAWQLAPGLLILTAAALLIPLLTNRQLYCHHLCPHGAAQQLLRNVLPKKWHRTPPERLAKLLRLIPFTLLVTVIIVAMRHLSFPLSSMEPFDAYLITVAGFATIAIAIVGLLASLFIPMAYCRYGCPTGAVLDFLWAHGRHDKFTRRDAAAILLLVIAIAFSLKTNAQHQTAAHTPEFTEEKKPVIPALREKSVIPTEKADGIVPLKDQMELLPKDFDFEAVARLLPDVGPDGLNTPVGVSLPELFQKWGKSNPNEAANFVMAAPDSYSPQLLEEVAEGILSRDLESGIEWVQTIPDGPYFDAAAEAAVLYLRPSYPEQALEMANLIGNPELRKREQKRAVAPLTEKGGN